MKNIIMERSVISPSLKSWLNFRVTQEDPYGVIWERPMNREERFWLELLAEDPDVRSITHLVFTPG